MAQDTRFKAPDNDDFAGVDKKIAGWLAAQPGVQSTKIGENLDFGTLNTRLKVIQNNLDNDLGNDPAKMLNDPKNADVKKAILDYFKPADQHPTSSGEFLDQLEKIKLSEPLATAPAAPAASAPVPKFLAPDDIGAADRKIDQYLSTLPGVGAVPKNGDFDFGALNTKAKIIQNTLDNNLGNDPVAFLRNPANAAVANAIADYFKPASQNPISSQQFLDRIEKLADAQPPISSVTPPLKQWDPTLTAKNAGGFDSRAGAFGSEVDLGQKGRLATEIFQPTEAANSQLTVNPSPTALPTQTPAVQPVLRQGQRPVFA